MDDIGATGLGASWVPVIDREVDSRLAVENPPGAKLGCVHRLSDVTARDGIADTLPADVLVEESEYVRFTTGRRHDLQSRVLLQERFDVGCHGLAEP